MIEAERCKYVVLEKVMVKKTKKARIWRHVPAFVWVERKFQNSSATLSLALPFALRDANTFRPFLVAIRLRNPCLFLLFLKDGWNVLFISIYFLLLLFEEWAAKLLIFFEPPIFSAFILLFGCDFYWFILYLGNRSIAFRCWMNNWKKCLKKVLPF
jgi:hypothetical protein